MVNGGDEIMELVPLNIPKEYSFQPPFNYYNIYEELCEKYHDKSNRRTICGVCFRELHVRFTKSHEISMKNLFRNIHQGICFLVHEQCKREIRFGFFDEK